MKKRIEIVRYYLRRVMCVFGIHDPVIDYMGWKMQDGSYRSRIVKWCPVCDKTLAER